MTIESNDPKQVGKYRGGSYIQPWVLAAHTNVHKKGGSPFFQERQTLYIPEDVKVTDEEYPTFIRDAAIYLYNNFGYQRMQLKAVLWCVFRIDVKKEILKDWLYRQP